MIAYDALMQHSATFKRWCGKIKKYEDKNASNGCIMIIFLVLINSILNTKMALFDGTFIHEWFKMSNVFQINNEQYNVMFDHSLLGIKTCWLNHLSLFQVH